MKKPGFFLLLFLLPAWGLAFLGVGCNFKKPPAARQDNIGDIKAQVHEFCGHCHAYPPAETFPRKQWKEEVERGYQFARNLLKDLKSPPIEHVIKYYQDQAPEELPLARPKLSASPLPIRFEPMHFPVLPKKVPPCISNVNLVHLFDAKRLDVLCTEMSWGLIMVLSPYEMAPRWKILAQVSNPAHTEVLDLDGDGIQDILVANLGNFEPTDRPCGSVVWLRGQKDGTFQPHTLLDNVGRVADVQAADFRGVGKKDLVVASFGWQKIGEIHYLENHTTDWSRPFFKDRVVDDRHGSIHVPVTDLNNDGKPDFVALFAQEHEAVVAFLNQGNGQFDKKTIWEAPHPAYGSSGIQLVDFDGDGDLDVLYSNGDTLDRPFLLKPYHSIQWLENKGTFPFVHHHLAHLNGVHRAVAADLAKTGRKDVVGVTFLPRGPFPQREKMNLEAILVMEQIAPGQFADHALETRSCDHVTVAVGDVFGSGRQDIVTATFSPHDMNERALTVWRNLGPAAKK
jgi:hypothetical protein